MENNRIVQVHTESSPNPNSLKFVVDQVLTNETVDFPDPASASHCELAKDLFKFSFVKRVFISNNFITVTKAEDIEWSDTIPMLKALIKSSLEEGKPLFTQSMSNATSVDENDPEIVQKIKVILDEYIRPAVEQDGGAINFSSYEEGIVKVLLQGSCSGCPSSTITLKAGIENLLKRMIPEVKEVIAVGV